MRLGEVMCIKWQNAAPGTHCPIPLEVAGNDTGAICLLVALVYSVPSEPSGKASPTSPLVSEVKMVVL